MFIHLNCARRKVKESIQDVVLYYLFSITCGMVLKISIWSIRSAHLNHLWCKPVCQRQKTNIFCRSPELWCFGVVAKQHRFFNSLRKMFYSTEVHKRNFLELAFTQTLVWCLQTLIWCPGDGIIFMLEGPATFHPLYTVLGPFHPFVYTS